MTLLPDATLRDILDRAKKATPGPWITRGERLNQMLLGRNGTIVCDPYAPNPQDAPFIASCDPSTVAAMASELLAARKVVGAAKPSTIGVRSLCEHSVEASENDRNGEPRCSECHAPQAVGVSRAYIERLFHALAAYDDTVRGTAFAQE